MEWTRRYAAEKSKYNYYEPNLFNNVTPFKGGASECERCGISFEKSPKAKGSVPPFKNVCRDCHDVETLEGE
jgi:hypothetical protein